MSETRDYAADVKEAHRQEREWLMQHATGNAEIVSNAAGRPCAAVYYNPVAVHIKDSMDELRNVLRASIERDFRFTGASDEDLP